MILNKSELKILKLFGDEILNIDEIVEKTKTNNVTVTYSLRVLEALNKIVIIKNEKQKGSGRKKKYYMKTETFQKEKPIIKHIDSGKNVMVTFFLKPKIFNTLESIAKSKGVLISDLIKVKIIPDWLQTSQDYTPTLAEEKQDEK